MSTSQNILTTQHTHARVHTHTCAGTGSEIYLVQGQHVEVTDVVLLSVSDPQPALLLIDHLSHILAHKLTLRGKSIFQLAAPVAAQCHGMLRVYLLNVVGTAKTPSPRKCPEDLHLAILTFGECLVEAALTCWTNLQVGKISICFGCQ